MVAEAQDALSQYGKSVSYRLIYKDLYPADAENLEKVLQGLGQEDITRDAVITALTKESGLSREEVERRYDTAMTLSTLTATLAGFYGPKGAGGTKDIGEAAGSAVKPTLDLFGGKMRKHREL
ncbi:hypothetical protein QZH46_14945 [Pseudomonas corrugata]